LQRRIGIGIGGDTADIPPRKRVRFRTHDIRLACRGAHDIAHVEVPVSWLLGPFRNPVAIEVEDLRLAFETGQTGFFLSLAQGYTRQLDIPIRMPAELQPSVELAVMGQQDTLAISTDQPGGGSEVSVEPGAREGEACSLRGFVQQRLKFRDLRDFARLCPSIVRQCIGERIDHPRTSQNPALCLDGRCRHRPPPGSVNACFCRSLRIRLLGSRRQNRRLARLPDFADKGNEQTLDARPTTRGMIDVQHT